MRSAARPLESCVTSELRWSRYRNLLLPPRQGEFHLVAGFGDRPLLPSIIDPFGKAQRPSLGWRHQINRYRSGDSGSKDLTGKGMQFVIIKVQRRYPEWQLPPYPMSIPR